MSVSLAILTNEDQLRRLADGGSFERGTAYFAHGQVRALRFDGERIVATVSGSQTYRVRLWRDDGALGGDLAWSCTCPVGDIGAFCKHAVAVGLAWLAGGNASADKTGKCHRLPRL
ncbi:MAG: SWIM zinc finger family protein [Alphaproteobacteria bacterium]|nr:SWIM zinc finger family protein [Alphaproteobacteria bacterium]